VLHEPQGLKRVSSMSFTLSEGPTWCAQCLSWPGKGTETQRGPTENHGLLSFILKTNRASGGLGHLYLIVLDGAKTSGLPSPLVFNRYTSRHCCLDFHIWPVALAKPLERNRILVWPGMPPSGVPVQRIPRIARGKFSSHSCLLMEQQFVSEIRAKRSPNSERTYMWWSVDK